MAIQDHDWFSIIMAEIVAWTIIYWQRGKRWSLLVKAIDGTITLGNPGGPGAGQTAAFTNPSHPGGSGTTTAAAELGVGPFQA